VICDLRVVIVANVPMQEVEPMKDRSRAWAFPDASKNLFRNFVWHRVSKNFLIYKKFLICKNHFRVFCRLLNLLLHAGDIISVRRDADYSRKGSSSEAPRKIRFAAIACRAFFGGLT